MEPQHRWKKRGQSLRDTSKALAVPSLFLGGPLGVGAVGYFVGDWWFDRPVAGGLIGAFLGLIVAVWETIKIVRSLSDEG